MYEVYAIALNVESNDKQQLLFKISILDDDPLFREALKDYLQKMSDPVLTDCPQCKKSTFAKQLTAAGFQLKGSGWYATDFKGSGSKGGTSKPEVSGEAKSGEAKPESKSDAKPEVKSEAKSEAKAETKTAGTTPQ